MSFKKVILANGTISYNVYCNICKQKTGTVYDYRQIPDCICTNCTN